MKEVEMQPFKLVAPTALAAATLAIAAGAGAAPKASSEIAFSSNRSGDTEIYTMNPDGTGVRRLTHSPKYDAPAAWSPDGRKLLFYSQRSAGGDVWVMNADGTGQRNLTTNPAHDGPGGWSPDGRQIVFDSSRDGNGIYVMKADGSGVKR